MLELIKGLCNLLAALCLRVFSKDHSRAGARAYEGLVQIASVIPIAIVSALIFPFLGLQFLTRSISTIIHLISGKDISLPNGPSAKAKPVSYPPVEEVTTPVKKVAQITAEDAMVKTDEPTTDSTIELSEEDTIEDQRPVKAA